MQCIDKCDVVYVSVFIGYRDGLTVKRYSLHSLVCILMLILITTVGINFNEVINFYSQSVTVFSKQ